MFTSSDQYYLSHIIPISKNEPVVFIEDVYTDANVLLLERDTEFNSRRCNLICQHKLKNPLDELAVIANRVKITDIIIRANELIKQKPYLQLLCNSLPQRDTWVNAFRHIALNTLLANKLTVMQRRLPELFDHSIQVAIMAVALGSELRLANPTLTMLAMAGLLHDMGELHMDPQLLDAKTQWSEQEWQDVYAHPAIAFDFLSRHIDIPLPVSKAVYEHHERISGSGYPQGLAGDKLGKLGRILAAAEVVSSICQQTPPALLATVFKSCDSGLDAYVVKAVNRLLWRMRVMSIKTDLPSPSIDIAELSHLCDTISHIMRSWKPLASRLNGYPLERAKRLFSRVNQIHIALRDAGIEPENCENCILHVTGETTSLLEIASLLREIRFQLSAIINETQRGWCLKQEHKSDVTLAVEQWLKQAKKEALIKSERPAIQRYHSRSMALSR